MKILLFWGWNLIKVLSVRFGQILSKVSCVTKIPLNCHINYQSFLFPSAWITQGDIFMTMETFSVCFSCLISFQMKSFSQKIASGFHSSVDFFALPLQHLSCRSLLLSCPAYTSFYVWDSLGQWFHCFAHPEWAYCCSLFYGSPVSSASADCIFYCFYKAIYVFLT